MITPQAEIQTLMGVSVTQMAKMVGLSVRRFYQLMNSGIFPFPVYQIATRKPMFTEQQQLECIEVKRRQCGINGQVVFFHSPRQLSASKSTTRKKSVTPNGRHESIRTGLAALGLSPVTDAQIEAAIGQAFPVGTGQTPEHEVVRQVFLRVNAMKKSGDKVGG